MQIDSQLIDNNQKISNLKIILIKTQKPIDANSFRYSPECSANLGVTNSTQSSLIYQYLSKILLIQMGDNGIGKLIHKNQDSVSFQILESQDQLQIIGTLQNVNKVLSQQIIFANSSQINQNSSQAIYITLNDGINYPLKDSIKISDCNFILLKKQIQNKIYSRDTTKIIYLTYLQNSDGEFVQIPPSLWLQQQSSDKLNFKGTTTSSLYRNYYKFQVKATDGYTTAADVFVVQVSGILFIYAINLLIKILGPILGILGLYQQRHHFYNIIFQKQVTFPQEEIECGKEYQKRLINIGKQHEDGIFIVRTLFKQVMQKPLPLLSKGEIEYQTHRVSDVQQNNVDNLYEEEVIFADVLGFPQKKPSSFQPSIGQSIHANFYNINQIIAFKKREICSCLRPIYKFLILEYKDSNQITNQTKFQIQQKIRQPRILLQNSQVKYEFLKSNSNSVSPSSLNSINFILTNQSNQDYQIQRSIESNIGEELSKSEIIAFSVFTPHINSIAEKQSEQCQKYQQILQIEKYDEINESN
ncbi:hypothetical protein ABPG72_012304 [Tetrahymena utriculariae]